MEDTLSLVLDRTKNRKLQDCQDLLPLIQNHKSKLTPPPTLIDGVLISRLIAGDRSAYSFVFTAYYKDFVLFATRFTHELNSAEEIVQDTFVELWEGHESVRVNISLKSYLLKIVRNKCIDWYRHKKIMQTHTDFIMESPPLFICDTDSYILYSELHQQIEATLDKLPEDVSETFRLNRNKGLKYHEIADLLGVSVRTIEVRMGKALHMLRTHLKEYFIIVISFLCLFFQQR
jgi:RNA polymerase sigma-70 factor (ECF subfamily)